MNFVAGWIDGQGFLYAMTDTGDTYICKFPQNQVADKSQWTLLVKGPK